MYMYMKGREWRTRYIVCVISVWRVTWLPASCTWLSEGAKDSIFLRTVNNRGVFCEYYAWFFMNAQFISRSASVFSHYRARVSKCSRSHPLLAIWIERPDWSIFEFLTHDFLKTSCTGHIARSILSSLPLLSTLGKTNAVSIHMLKLSYLTFISFTHNYELVKQWQSLRMQVHLSS